MARDYWRSPVTGEKKPIFRCEVDGCTEFGAYSRDADLKSGKVGTWRCRKHLWPDFLPHTDHKPPKLTTDMGEPRPPR